MLRVVPVDYVPVELHRHHAICVKELAVVLQQCCARRVGSRAEVLISVVDQGRARSRRTRFATRLA